MTINNIFILLNFELFPKKNMRVSRLVQRCTKFEYAFHTLIQVSYFVWTCTKHDNYDYQYYSRDSGIRIAFPVTEVCELDQRFYLMLSIIKQNKQVKRR